MGRAGHGWCQVGLVLCIGASLWAGCNRTERPAATEDAAAGVSHTVPPTIGIQTNGGGKGDSPRPVPMDAGKEAATSEHCQGTRECKDLLGSQCLLAGCAIDTMATCSGTPSACSTYDGLGNTSQCFAAGCTFTKDQHCTGTPKPCAQVQALMCDGVTVKGCTAPGACMGTPKPCNENTFEYTCNAQPGCHWM